MFDSLEEQMAKDENKISSPRERIMRWLIYVVAAVHSTARARLEIILFKCDQRQHRPKCRSSLRKDGCPKQPRGLNRSRGMHSVSTWWFFIGNPLGFLC